MFASLPKTLAPPFLLATLAAISLHHYAGPTIGAYLGAALLISLLLPPLILIADLWCHRLILLAAVGLPFLIQWLTIRDEMSALFSELTLCALVLLAWALLLTGLVAALARILPAALASTATMVFALAWQTWPIYLSRAWNGSDSAPAIARWAIFNPIMQIDGILSPRIGSWTAQSVAYHLTDLVQNVPYSAPSHTWLCILTHTALGALLLFTASFPHVAKTAFTPAAGAAPAS